LQEFEHLVGNNEFVRNVLNLNLTIPSFDLFLDNIKKAYREIKVDPEYQGGDVATYIPPLAKALPEWFATSFCSADG